MFTESIIQKQINLFELWCFIESQDIIKFAHIFFMKSFSLFVVKNKSENIFSISVYYNRTCYLVFDLFPFSPLVYLYVCTNLYVYIQGNVIACVCVSVSFSFS